MSATSDFVLLCYPRNTPYSWDAHTPVPIFALGTYLETKGVDVEYFDERVDGRGKFDALLARRPRVVGVSIIGGYQFASARRLSRIAKRLSPGSTVVWGGVGPTTLPDLSIAEPEVDFVALGEGEETLHELYEALADADSPPASVPGLLYQEDGAIRRTPTRAFPDVEALPFVYQGKAEEGLRRYLERGTIRETVGYEVSRGCPFLCSFCYSPNFHNDTRTKSVDKVAEELVRLKKLGVEDLDVYDDTLFGARRKMFPRYLELFEKNRFTWIGNLRINMLDRELLERLHRSGCKWIYFGVESNKDEILEKIKKGVTAAEIEKGLEVMRESPIPAVYSIIYGLPFEEERRNLGRCLDFAQVLHDNHPDAEIQVQSFVPLPGTDLYRNAVDFGFSAPETLDGWIRHDHFGTTNPWLDDPSLANKVYISSFLAFRYKRHLSGFPLSLFAWPLHRLSRWRIRKRFFGLYFEKILYNAVLAAGEALVAAYFFFLDLFSRFRLPPPPPDGRTRTQEREA
jgi:radical SAM superfamily enzyme YgiQ (UPF0313 family)